MKEKKIDSPKESNNNKGPSLEPELVNINNRKEKQKTKYFINKHYQLFISIIFFIIGCIFLSILYSFVFSIYVRFYFYFFYSTK